MTGLPPAAEGCVASLVHGAGSGKASPDEGGAAKPAVGAGVAAASGGGGKQYGDAAAGTRLCDNRLGGGVGAGVGGPGPSDCEDFLKVAGGGVVSGGSGN